MGTASAFSTSKPSLPTKTLVKHIKRRDWSACKSRLSNYPWDAHYANKDDKATPLHLVCVYRAPLDVVTKLVDANPSAITARNGAGWTPIHLIVLHGSDDPQIAILLIERGGMQAASMESPFSGSPLHLACLYGTSRPVLRAIVEANPSMVSRGTSGNGTDGPRPMENLWKGFCKKGMNVQTIAHSHDLFGQISVLLDGCEISARQEQVSATGSGSSSIPSHIDNFIHFNEWNLQDPNDKTVGAILYQVVDKQPLLGNVKEFLDATISAFPESQLQYVDPQTGNGLLHCACSRPPSNRRPSSLPLKNMPTSLQESNNSSSSSSKTDRDLIDVLVDALPRTVEMTNHDAEYPLHIALSQGRRTWRTGISSLVNGKPQLLMVRDQTTKLYPFQMAATTSTTTSDSITDEDIVETVFHLLLGCPHVLIQSQQ